ncbi:hypothetical protein DERP_003800 [Dermatophagoides pteronyssinus]|uniref:Uncharacterized protein n=1 Tax=Dermatophagoides pteronyssinus TaxID=6956 RepID=A0ABQ8JLM9_DERPT|nr:hypothetical protein DERP_003800 [Dermatophagoides pteronyssinus]
MLSSVHRRYVFEPCEKQQLTSAVMIAILSGLICPRSTFNLRSGFFLSLRFETREPSGFNAFDNNSRHLSRIVLFVSDGNDVCLGGCGRTL